MNDELRLLLFAKKCAELSIMNKNLIEELKQIKNIVDNSYTYEYEAIIDIKNIIKKEEHTLLQKEKDKFEEYKQLKTEIERLKEEIEIRDNLSEKFRKEALSWANIANEYQKDKTKLEKTLQEIKKIVGDNQFYFGEGTIVSYETIKQLATNFYRILDLITKAEEE